MKEDKEMSKNDELVIGVPYYMAQNPYQAGVIPPKAGEIPPNTVVDRLRKKS